LDEAGWRLDGEIRKKDGIDLRLSVVTTKDSDFEASLDVLASQWRKIGVVITTKIVDPADPAQNVVQNILQQRNFDVLVYQLTIGADADIFAYWHSSQANPSGYNFSNYSNTSSDDALASARSNLQPELRNVKYLIFSRQWLADVPAIGLYQSTTQYVSAKTVRAVSPEGVLVSPIDRYADVLYWTVGERVVFKTP
jgi:peptide/nickel transport system substrate-binding protein